MISQGITASGDSYVKLPTVKQYSGPVALGHCFKFKNVNYMIDCLMPTNKSNSIECVKVLHVGAHEELIMNYFRNFKSGRIRFDYILRKNGVDFRFKDDPSFNGRLHYITPMQTSVWGWIKELRAVIRSDTYSHVHLHFGWANIYGLIAGIGLGTKMISHNLSYYESSSRFRKFMRRPLKFLINYLSDYNFAVTVDSGRQMFNNNYVLLPTAIDYCRFGYSNKERTNIRKEFDISFDSIVFGHVGNFYEPKNHGFLIRVFSEIRKLVPLAMLILVGADFGTQDEVRAEVNRLELDEYVVFAGDRSDVERLLCALDVFLFPSLFEGFGMALLEAEVCGLPCVYSSSLSTDAVISPFCTPCDLENGAKAWAVKAVELCSLGLDSDARIQRISALPNIYNVADVAHQLENFYLSTAESMEA
jgi:glycosyltransferase involved in cell wall biosynthesis